MTDVTDFTSGGDPAVDARGFRRALGQFTTGVTIVTAAVGNERVGVTANSFSSLSLDPPLIMWAVSSNSRSLTTLMTASHFAVNVLAADQIALSTTFARSVDDKFVGVAWQPGYGGAPLLADVAASFECRREHEYDGGDHVIMVGRVERYQRSEREPLLYTQGRYGLAVEHPATRDVLQSATHHANHVVAYDALVPLLFRAARQVSSAFDEHRKLDGLNQNQGLVLTVLSELPDATLERVVAMSLMEVQDAEDAVSALKDMNLIELSAAQALRLTASGQARLSALTTMTRSVETALTKHLATEEINITRRVLSSLINNASAADTLRALAPSGALPPST